MVDGNGSRGIMSRECLRSIGPKRHPKNVHLKSGTKIKSSIYYVKIHKKKRQGLSLSRTLPT